MLVRFQVWRSRRRAKHLSKYHQGGTVAAAVNGIHVGYFNRGKETDSRGVRKSA